MARVDHKFEITYPNTYLAKLTDLREKGATAEYIHRDYPYLRESYPYIDEDSNLPVVGYRVHDKRAVGTRLWD
jgi:hypothetical protein